MASIANYSLLQEFHSRPAPAPLSIYKSSLGTDPIYRNPNARLLDLASKSVQSRRRRGQHTSSSSNIKTSITSTSPPYNRYINFDSERISQVYSEIMMNNDNTPKAKWTPAFSSQVSQKSASINSIKPHNESKLPSLGTKRDQLSRKRASRQRPVSRNGLASVSLATSPLSSEGDGHRRHRSKVLTQALRKSKEMRGFNKSVDLTLVKPLPLTTTAYGGNDEEEDEDWAAFINSGYVNFPLPPDSIAVSPATATTNAATTGRSDATFSSATTWATSLASSGAERTGVDWLDDELAWASSDEEEEIVRSPKETSMSKRISGTSDVFCTPDSSPHIGSSPRMDKKYKRGSMGHSKGFAKALIEAQDRAIHQKTVPAAFGDKQVAEEFKLLQEARIGAFGRGMNTDRHGSVSSTVSSSSAMSRESSGASSTSTRSSATTATSIGSHGGDSKAGSASCSPERTTLALPSQEARHVRLPQDKSTPLTPTRMTSLYHCVEVKGEQGIDKRPLLGDWLTDSTRLSTRPSMEVFNHDESSLEEMKPDSATLKQAMLFSRSSTDLLRVMNNKSEHHLPRRPSRTTILANCDPSERRPSFQNCSEDRSSLAYLQQQQSTTTGKQQGTAGKIKSRLAAKMNMATAHRNSIPDVPITPSSADSGNFVSSSGRHSPSNSIFGSAAINARASNYVTAAAAAAAAAATNPTLLSPSAPSQVDSAAPSLSWQQRRRASSECSIYHPPIGKAGFCFDYDPASPLYTSGIEDNQMPSPTTSRSPPPSSFWRRNNAKAHEAVVAG